MKKSFFIALMAVVAFAVTSCSTTLKSVQEPIVKFDLTSADFVLSEQVTGQAAIHRILGVDWARLFTNNYGTISVPLVGVSNVTSLNMMYAVYDLIEKHPGYDFVMYPQFSTKVVGVPGLYEKTEIKVTARLGKLKK
ncbi:MAG: hypothetical protein IKZ51_06300 [Bacteroidales bacterium]|nr:hypothetical protein [Bacteroidales bacterium]